MFNKYFYFIGFFITLFTLQVTSKPITIPEMKEWTETEGTYTFNTSTDIIINPAYYEEFIKPAEIFQEDVKEVFGINLQILKTSSPQKDDIYFTKSEDYTLLKNDGYLLDIGYYIEIQAVSDTGAFYATRSIIQMLRQSKSIEKGTARDYSDYPERGLMIDNGRKYFSMKNLKDYIRELSYFKMNLFHLHISDFEGFRMESEKYPFIQSDKFYTKEELRELVALGEKYYVCIVPEIDVPNHLTRIISNFPQFQIYTNEGHSIGDCCIDFTKPDAMNFLKDLFSEYFEIFKAPYWHLGTDEFFLNYSELPQFQEFAIKQYGQNAKPSDAFVWFINEMNSFVKQNGKSMRIWNDVFEYKIIENNIGTIDKDITIECWKGDYNVNNMLDSNYHLMNCNWYYLNYTVGQGWRPNQKAIYYSWTPGLFEGDIQANSKQNIIGSKIQMWSDEKSDYTEMQAFVEMRDPLRIFAHRNWNSELFKDDLEQFKKSFKIIGNAPFVYPDTILLPNDLCLFKKVVSSADESLDLKPENAVDGDYSTRWSSAYVDTAWIYVDFEKIQHITRIKLNWEWSFAKDYKIEVSDDAQVWNTIVTMTDNDGGFDIYDDIYANGRYLRVYCTKRNGTNGNSLWEIEAYDSTALSSKDFDEGYNVHDFRVYPNPCSDKFRIQCNFKIDAIAKVEIFNILGEKVSSIDNISVHQGQFYKEISIAGVPAGEYFVKLLVNENAYYQKILIK